MKKKPKFSIKRSFPRRLISTVKIIAANGLWELGKGGGDEPEVIHKPVSTAAD